MTTFVEAPDLACLEVAEDLVSRRLPAIMAEYPLLNPHGWGEPFSHYGFCANCDRDELLRYSSNIAYAVCWLSSENRIIRHDFCTSTYLLKHRMEDRTGRYVGNGEMIAAFLILGLPIRLDDFNPAVTVRR